MKSFFSVYNISCVAQALMQNKDGLERVKIFLFEALIQNKLSIEWVFTNPTVDIAPSHLLTIMKWS